MGLMSLMGLMVAGFLTRHHNGGRVFFPAILVYAKSWMRYVTMTLS